jgi:hypothetical protein
MKRASQHEMDESYGQYPVTEAKTKSALGSRHITPNFIRKQKTQTQKIFKQLLKDEYQTFFVGESIESLQT